MSFIERWPPDYPAKWEARGNMLQTMQSSPAALVGMKEYYRTRPGEFIEHWCITLEPRNAGSDKPTLMPFIPFRKQRELVEFLHACLLAQSSGLVEKSRDMGATWLCAAFSVWLWLYWPGAVIGWGSYKQDLVDKLGVPNCIFEKIRATIRHLPEVFWPKGFSLKEHMTFMRVVNPETQAAITGEVGDNIGRGGRSLIYFKDESAHYEHAEAIEAALLANTRVQIDISSVNGLGNVFHRKRENGHEWIPGFPAEQGRTNVFVLDWRDHPEKTQAWYDAGRQKAVDDGLAHLWAQEVDRDYSGAVQGVIIPAEWVRAAIDAHIILGFGDVGMWTAALDVADGGTDRNALAKVKGVVLRKLEEWGERDTGVTARRAVAGCQDTLPIEVQYDCIGVGAGVKAETNRLSDEKLMPAKMRFTSWDAGAGPLHPEKRVVEGDRDSPLNQDFYANLKAQGWWMLRRRFEKTYRAIKEKIKFPLDELISLDSKLPLLRKLEKELSQPTAGRTSRMKLMINKMPDGARSPNLADCVMMAYWPAGSSYTLDWIK